MNESSTITEIEKGGLTRRALLASASMLGLGAVAAGMAGCAPAPRTADPESTGNAELSATGRATTELNPQEVLTENFEADVSALFEPLSLGGLTLPNRLVKSAAGSYALSESFADPAAVGFYREVARGGSALVLVEDCFWLAESPDNLRPVVDAIHEEGSLAGIQIWGMWNQCSSDKPSASPLEAVGTGFPRAQMSTDEVHEFQQYVLGLVDVYAQAGFDLVELNASCDHAFASFLSRFLNVSRDDEYGPQSFENRARILTEIISAIKEAHPEMTVQVLYSGIEENVEALGDSELCIQPEEAVAFAKLFEAAGADSLQVRSTIFGNHAAGFIPDLLHVGCHGNTGLGTQMDLSQHMGGVVDGAHEGVGTLVQVASIVHDAVSIPVGVVGDMDPRLAPELCNSAVADGLVDFLVINRPLLADPHLPNKLKDGQADQIRPCNKCVSCFQSIVSPDGVGFCRVNPAHVRAYSEAMPEGYEPETAPESKTVMVIGGGPAGMEAALTAAKRGHAVTLYEEDSALGGRATFAAAIKGPHERIDDYLNFQARQLEEHGVTVVTGTRVEADLVEQENPDAVIVATGGAVPAASLQAVSDIPVIAFEDVASFEAPESVVIVGGSLRATDYANKLVNEGVKVALVHQGTEEDLAASQAPWVRAVALSWLKAQGMRLFNGATNIATAAEGVQFTTSYGTEKTVACDAIVLCDDLTPDDSLEKSLSGRTVVRVGDCQAPASIMEAVEQGHMAARAL